MPSPVVSIIIASIQSVAKVFVVGAAGFFAVQYPQKAPFLPVKAIGALARYSFNLLVIPLIYTTIAQSVTPLSLGTYWFVVVACVVVTAIAFGTATLLYHFGRGCSVVAATNNNHNNINHATTTQQQQLQLQQHRDFNALRVSIAFPNIVALPILIFPSLCEYPVVYQQALVTTNSTVLDAAASVQECQTQSNAMIFCYFFIWTLLFYGVGYPFLLPPPPKQQQQQVRKDKRESQTTATTAFTDDNQSSINLAIHEATNDGDGVTNDDMEQQPESNLPADNPSQKDLIQENLLESEIDQNDNPETLPEDNQRRIDHKTFWKFVKDITWGSPGMMAMFLGFITACIPPLRHALFDAGGCLRFLGSALETLGQASTPVSTMVVAASLVPLPQEPAIAPSVNEDGHGSREGETIDDNMIHSSETQSRRLRQRRLQRDSVPVEHVDEPSEYFESPVMSDPNFGPHQYQPRQSLPHPTTPSRHDRIRRSQLLLTAAIRRSSMRLSTTLRTTPEMRRLHIWFIMTRLVVTPALVVACLWGLEWSGLLQSVPTLAKLVVVVNSALPGALIVVVILQASLPTHQVKTATQQNHNSVTVEGDAEDSNKNDDDLDADEEDRGLSQIQTAAVVTKVYLTSYLLSIVTISAWTALGLWIILPKNAS